VFFVTVGTGVGGGFVHDGRLLGTGRPRPARSGTCGPACRRFNPTRRWNRWPAVGASQQPPRRDSLAK
jgi:hypothetical protein